MAVPKRSRSTSGGITSGGNKLLQRHGMQLFVGALFVAIYASNQRLGHSITRTTQSSSGLPEGGATLQQFPPKQPHPLPSLDTLITRATTANPQVIGNVEWLLDFAVVGFGKCGTTTLLEWLAQPNPNNVPSTSTSTKTKATSRRRLGEGEAAKEDKEDEIPPEPTSLVRAPSHEPQWLTRQEPFQLVKTMYDYAKEEQTMRDNGELKPNERLFKSFKNPSDMRRPPSRDLLANYWPHTPLIVSVRHPVTWMVSIYNYYKIEKGRSGENIKVSDILAPGSRDQDGNTKHYVSTAKGEFHTMLAEIGKTSLSEDAEWQLLQPWLTPDARAEIHEHKMPNRIFFMEMRQMKDSNTTRSQQFAHDLERFLGLPHNHLNPTPLHVRPNARPIKKKHQEAVDALKMDICAPEWAPIHEEMVKIAHAASDWLQQYFMKAHDVYTSSPEYLRELLEEWKVSPCDTQQKENDDNKDGGKKD